LFTLFTGCGEKTLHQRKKDQACEHFRALLQDSLKSNSLENYSLTLDINVVQKFGELRYLEGTNIAKEVVGLWMLRECGNLADADLVRQFVTSHDINIRRSAIDSYLGIMHRYNVKDKWVPFLDDKDTVIRDVALTWGVYK
jgi:hypothetical protein